MGNAFHTKLAISLARATAKRTRKHLPRKAIGLDAWCRHLHDVAKAGGTFSTSLPKTETYGKMDLSPQQAIAVERWMIAQRNSRLLKSQSRFAGEFRKLSDSKRAAIDEKCVALESALYQLSRDHFTSIPAKKRLTDGRSLRHKCIQWWPEKAWKSDLQTVAVCASALAEILSTELVWKAANPSETIVTPRVQLYIPAAPCGARQMIAVYVSGQRAPTRNIRNAIRMLLRDLAAQSTWQVAPTPTANLLRYTDARPTQVVGRLLANIPALRSIVEVLPLNNSRPKGRKGIRLL